MLPQDFVLHERYTPSKPGRCYDKTAYVGTHPLFDEAKSKSRAMTSRHIA